MQLASRFALRGLNLSKSTLIKNLARKVKLPSKKTTLLLGGTTLLAYFGSQINEKTISAEELHELVIGTSGEFVEGIMKQVQIGPNKDDDIILVVRVDGVLYACGAKCSHIGARLVMGVLFEDRVYCPYHLASFSVKDGYPETGPMMDGIPTYKITEANGTVTVHVPTSISNIRASVPAKTRDPANKEKFVIIGGGVAGASAADTLRQSGFTGEIIILSSEDTLPYDRSTLTKEGSHELDVSRVHLRSQDFYDQHGITVQLNTKVTGVDSAKKTIHTESGSKIVYDKLLVATGLSARPVNIPGNNLKNIFTIRDYSDLVKMRESAKTSKNVVVIGAGFIGVEAASSIKMEYKENVNVTVVSKLGPYRRIFGPEVSAGLQHLGEINGINFIVGEDAVSFEGMNLNNEGSGSVTKVKLESGKVIDADLVIVGKGQVPNTWFLKDIALDADGGVNADVFLRSTSNKDIFAAGDIVSYPHFFSNERIRVEHITEAFGQGAYAAWNMLGKMVPYDGVPYYWTRQFGKSISSVGSTINYDKIVFDGNPKDHNFVCFYFRNGKVIGGAGMQRSTDLILLNQAMRLSLETSEADFKDGKLNIEGLKSRIAENRPKCACNRGKNIAAPKKV